SLSLFNGSSPHRDLHSFPTRRSSDLDVWRERGGAFDGAELLCHFVAFDFQRRGSTREVITGPDGPGPNALMGFQLPISPVDEIVDRKSTRLNSSHVKISYAVFCLKKK